MICLAGFSNRFNFLQVKEQAIELAKAMQNEDGVSGAVNAFLKHLCRKLEPDRRSAKSSLFSVRSCFGCS